MIPEEIINKMFDIIHPIINRKKLKTLDFPVDFTFFHALERIDNNLQTLNLLIKNDIIKYKHTIGLVCRNILSDFITTGFIVLISKDLDDFHVNLYRLYYNDLLKSESFLNLYVKAGLATEDDLTKYNNKKK